MATDDPYRFEAIDWDELGGLGLSRESKLNYAVLGVFALLICYQYLVAGPSSPLVPGTEIVLTPVDWMFVATLLLGVLYGALPAYRNAGRTRYYWRRFKRNKAAVVSAIYLAVILTIGTVGSFVLGPTSLNILQANQPPVGLSVAQETTLSCVGPVENGRCQGTMAHPFGTTSEGEDMLTLVVTGMKISMQVGLIGMAIVVFVGTAVGLTAAFFGGLVDEVLMRYVDIQITFPAFFLFLLISYLFTPTLFLLIVIFGFFGWGGTARLVRSEALQRREEEYVTAARGAGAKSGWIIRKHLLPNVSSTVITVATLTVPGFILTEAALSFLQLTDPSIASWGKVIASGRGNLADAWWIATIPGVFLFLTILAFNYVGDALRDALDPRGESGS